MPMDYWERSNSNPARVLARLTAAIPLDRSGCWPWPDRKLSNGYGVIRAGVGKTHTKLYVHRASYETFIGSIPDGMQIDHLCRNRSCFNPEHLEPVPNRTNFIRGEHPNAVVYRTQICRKGLHPMTGDNIMESPHGRRCRACNYEWQRARRARRSQAQGLGRPRQRA